MIFSFLNDTKEDLYIHPASGLKKSIIAPGEIVQIEVPEGQTMFQKLWNGAIMFQLMPQEEVSAYWRTPLERTGLTPAGDPMPEGGL